MTEILEKIEALDPHVQLKIVHTVWENLSMPEDDISEADKARIRESYAQYKANPETAIPVDMAFEIIRKRFAF